MKHATTTGQEWVTAAIATGHAGEIVQGAIREGNRTRRLLLSLPAPALWSRAKIIETPGEPLAVQPAWAHKTLRAARILLRRLDIPFPHCSIRLFTNIPVGKGCGSSTTDILAALRVLLGYVDRTMTEEEIAKLIVEVEQATDGSVLSRPALFRHREGIVEEYLPGAFPDMQVVVIDAQPAAMIHTVSLPRAHYSESQLAQFQELLSCLRNAFRNGCAREIGRIATASACISQNFLPKPNFEALVEIVGQEEGYGLSVSHSGTVVSALLAPGTDIRSQARITKAAESYGMRVVTQYSLNGKVERGVAA